MAVVQWDKDLKEDHNQLTQGLDLDITMPIINGMFQELKLVMQRDQGMEMGFLLAQEPMMQGINLCMAELKQVQGKEQISEGLKPQVLEHMTH